MRLTNNTPKDVISKMKVDLNMLKGLGKVQTQAVQSAHPSPTSGPSFKSVLEKVTQGKQDPHELITQVTQGLIKGRSFSSQELIGLQVVSGQYHIKLELLSKVGESASAVAKKFSQGNA